MRTSDPTCERNRQPCAPGRRKQRGRAGHLVEPVLHLADLRDVSKAFSLVASSKCPWPTRFRTLSVIPLVLPLFMLLAACSKSTRLTTSFHASGDLGQEILQIAISHGGRALGTNNLPTVNTTWRRDVFSGGNYQAGREEVQIHLAQDCFHDLTNCLVRAFGQPASVSSHNGSVHGYYTTGQVGVAVQFYLDAQEAGMIVVGPPRRTGVHRGPERVERVKP